jgi:hypothetical protein
MLRTDKRLCQRIQFGDNGCSKDINCFVTCEVFPPNRSISTGCMDQGPVLLLVTLRNISLMFLDPTSVFGFFAGLPLLVLALPFATWPCMDKHQGLRLMALKEASKALSGGSPQRGEEVQENSPRKMKLHLLWQSPRWFHWHPSCSWMDCWSLRIGEIKTKKVSAYWTIEFSACKR